MSRLRPFLDRWIFEEYAGFTADLGLYRILVAAYLLVLVLPRWLEVGTFPDTFFKPPPSLAIFFSGFPPTWFFYALNSVAILASTCMLFGLRTRLAAVAFSVTYVLGNTWKYSLGKIDHDILIVVVPLVLAMSGWDRRYALDARRLGGTSRAEGWTVALLMFIVGLSMFAAGLQKVLGGWLDPGSQAVQSYVLFNHYANGHDPLAWGLVSKISAWWAWEAQDVLTVILELAFLPMIFWRGGAQVICVVAVAFHLGVLLTLDISFSANLLAYGVLVRWDRLRAWPVADRAMARAEGFLEGIRQWHVFLFGSALALAYLTIGNPFEHAPTLLWSDMPITSWLIMLIAVAISVAYLWFYLRGGVSSPDAAPAPAEAEPQEVEESAKH